jgi:hypothetical protein
MTTSEPPAWYKKYWDDTMDHGPLPMGINVSGSDNTVQYSVGIAGQVKTYSHHPLSPSGRREWGSLLEGAGEEKGRKAEAHGVAHPPIVYKPSEWTWVTNANLRLIMIEAFQLSNRRVTIKDLDSKENLKAVNELMKSRNDLYHPCFGTSQPQRAPRFVHDTAQDVKKTSRRLFLDIFRLAKIR